MTALSPKPFRPRWSRIVAGGLFVIIPGLAVMLIAAMVRNGTDQPNYTMAIVSVTLAAVIFLSMHLLVVAKPSTEGLYVRNLVHRQHLEWSEIVSVRFSPDRPWAQLDLAVGEPLNVMAIQSADGLYARGQAQRLAAWVKTGEAPEP